MPPNHPPSHPPVPPITAGDPNLDVREAAGYAAKAVMGILTGHGVKIVMPAVLRGLGETSWRSKTASIQVLGTMAFCAPKQLSACLPAIVPRLGEAFEDPHPNVQVGIYVVLVLMFVRARNHGR